MSDLSGLKRMFAMVMAAVVALTLVPCGVAQGQEAAKSAAPGYLRVDDFEAPLGLDDAAPRFSWVIEDGRTGARQTAYRVQVATSADSLEKGKADVWDSGRVKSGQSVGVVYRGPALKATTKYYWRVTAWDAAGKAYSAAVSTTWETGLMDAANWKADWVGSQNWEEAELRKANATWITAADGMKLWEKPVPAEQRIAYRLPMELTGKVKQAALYVTGQDVASAWVNGTQVLTGAALPGWKQLPWKKYVRADVTAQLKAGANLLAVETTHYVEDPNGFGTHTAPTMSATLVVKLDDGTVVSFASKTGAGWEASIGAGSWMDRSEAANWQPAVAFVAPTAADDPGKPWPAQTVKALRHEFGVSKPVEYARLYATALGAYQVLVNGKKAGNDVLAPGWTDYRERLKYQTYDVTTSVKQGANSISALIAPGWYSTPLQWYQQPNIYGATPPSLRAQLRIHYTDGSDEWVATDASWKATESAIMKAEIYDGETQDARLEQAGWKLAGFDDHGWQTVAVRQPELSKVTIDGQDFQPIQVEQTLTAKTVTEPQPGVWVYDFGQNFSGVEHLVLSGSAGTTVRVRTGEIVNADGTLYTDNLRTALSTDHFTLAGTGSEEFEPQFTFHGFRYLEVTGLAQELPVESVTAKVFHTNAKFNAKLETGSPMINQLWKNILWGQRSNFVGVPTDCPQRDERLGWTADAQVFWRTASYNMELAAFSRKFAGDIRGTQLGSGGGFGASPEIAGALFGIFAPGINTTSSDSAAGWSDAGVIIPWTSWIQTGDLSVVEQNWEAMSRYLTAIEKTNPDFLWKKNAGIPFGDWLSPEGPTQFPLVATASWAYDVTLMRQMAHAQGKTADEAHYAALFAKIQGAFQKAFVHDDGFVEGADQGPSPFGVINNPDAKAKGGDTQTGYVLALWMRLVPDAMRARVADHLAAKIEANHGLLGTGFLGTPYLLAVLTDTGHQELAYKLLLNTRYPSWGYLVGHGATTMWERWNGDQMKGDPSMNSYNHYAYGAVADWIYRYAAGVDATEEDAGFHTIRLHPAFSAQLGSIDFHYRSPYGQIASAWKVDGGTAKWTLEIPANSSGWLPLTAAQAAKWTLDGKPLGKAAARSGETGYALAAGKYSFTVAGVK
jgi:alpha-L-rhamnosidase